MSHIESSRPAESLKHRLREELRKYLIASAYLYVCFGAIQLYKAALLQGVGVYYAAWGIAAVKALIVGKFLLLGDAIHARLRRRPGGLPGRIAMRVFWLLLILILLTSAEELIAGWIHGHSFAELLAELQAGSMPVLLAEVLLVGLILVPLVAAAEVNQTLGPDVLRRQLVRAADGGRQADHDGAGDHESA
jgi:hypothetical protein